MEGLEGLKGVFDVESLKAAVQAAVEKEEFQHKQADAALELAKNESLRIMNELIALNVDGALIQAVVSMIVARQIIYNLPVTGYAHGVKNTVRMSKAAAELLLRAVSRGTYDGPINQEKSLDEREVEVEDATTDDGSV